METIKYQIGLFKREGGPGTTRFGIINGDVISEHAPITFSAVRARMYELLAKPEE